MTSPTPIVPIILSGGVGSRLWPLSRRAAPKHLLPLVGDESMIIETANRCRDANRFTAPLVVAGEDHRFKIAEQFRVAGILVSGMILEPQGRNTAAAVIIAAMQVQRQFDGDHLLLVMPSDHVIANHAGFMQAVGLAQDSARAGNLVTFGMRPDAPATGYGYIHYKAAGGGGVYPIEKFVEKPDATTAARFLARGDYLWNSGMFLFEARALLAEVAVLDAALLTACQKAFAAMETRGDFMHLPAAEFAAVPSISLDYAVMEKTRKGRVVPAEFGWSDVGAFDALWQVSQQDSAGMVTRGDVVAIQSSNSYLWSEEGRLLTAVGVTDLIVVATTDAVLVAPMSAAQEVKTLVDELKQRQRPEVELPAVVERPWGSYQSIALGAGYQAKRIMVKPGQKLSLQKHAHRAEHWVVVQGVALVTRDAEKIKLAKGETIYLPLGCVHRLENLESTPLILIEVQIGDYVGEDDIVRLEDIYGRS
ncbi:MAG: mannose-1-phosphate guanylyltransferase/mannose-6-phosphate isomerase [Candidatus Pacebacteria bacterium]|nr:mannose-1-phosphate guanylyltransferase/mannose-6-phosphate isomerase [Candidatus Paceibacterota bacterium]